MDLTSSDLELGADGSTLQYAAMRFNNLTIPTGATILSAFIEFEVDETGSDPTSVLIQGQAADNAPAFSAVNFDISSRARTAAQVAWNEIPAWMVISEKVQTPDLAPPPAIGRSRRRGSGEGGARHAAVAAWRSAARAGQKEEGPARGPRGTGR